MLSILLIACMLLPTLASCTRTPPEAPEIEEEEELDPRGDQSKYDYVFKVDTSGSRKDLLTDYNTSYTKGSIDYSLTQEGEERSFKWHANGPNGNSGAYINTVLINDWTEYDAITLWIHSSKASGGMAQVRFSTPNVAGTNMNPYFRFQFNVDWTGWKEFTVNLNDLKSNYSPDIKSIQQIVFDCNGWDMPAADSVLNFGYMYLIKTSYEIIPSIDNVSEDVFTKAKNNWRTLLAGTAATNSTDTDNVNSKIDTVNKNCKNTLAQFNSTFSAKSGYSTGTNTSGAVIDLNQEAGGKYLYLHYKRFSATVKATYHYLNANGNRTNKHGLTLFVRFNNVANKGAHFTLFSRVNNVWLVPSCKRTVGWNF